MPILMAYLPFAICQMGLRNTHEIPSPAVWDTAWPLSWPLPPAATMTQVPRGMERLVCFDIPSEHDILEEMPNICPQTTQEQAPMPVQPIQTIKVPTCIKQGTETEWGQPAGPPQSSGGACPGPSPYMDPLKESSLQRIWGLNFWYQEPLAIPHLWVSILSPLGIPTWDNLTIVMLLYHLLLEVSYQSISFKSRISTMLQGDIHRFT